MASDQYIPDSNGLESSPVAGEPPSDDDGQAKSTTGRKARRRSVYLFPAYGFTTAIDIARRVEESGGGSLTEETLAVNLGLSARSSGFRLKSLAARQFQLVVKQGETLSTTPVAKAILKPTSGEDAQRGYRQSFLAIPLFQAVSERYRGQRLPDSQTLRNVLEREFHVEHSRVQQAERMLLDSARDAHLLKHRGDGTYLVMTEGANGAIDDLGDFGSTPVDSSPSGSLASPGVSQRSIPPAPANTIVFTLDEVGQLGPEEFEVVWRAIGILVRARSGNRALEAADGWDEI